MRLLIVVSCLQQIKMAWLYLALMALSSIAQAAIPATVNANLRKFLLIEGYTEVPLTIPAGHNLLLLDILLPDNQQAELILDTGAAFSLIEQRYANLLRAKLTGEEKSMSGANNLRAEMYKAIIPDLTLGNFTVHNESLYLTRKNFSYIKTDKHPVIGLLGLDYLMNHQAIIDVAGRRLYLKPVDIYYDDNFNFNYKAIPLEYTFSGHAVLIAAINQAKPEYFLFDTGAPVLMLSTAYAKALGLKQLAPAAIAQGIGGSAMKIFPTRIQQLTINNTNYFPKQVLITDLHYAQVGLPLAGVIGLDWMQAKQAIIDVQHDMVYVK